jgi:CHAD domain-containing protein
MPARRANSEPTSAPREALEKVLRRVLREQSAASKELAPDTVHDLRVALRRCRSFAEGFSEIDRHRDWRKLGKTAKRLQRGLAGVRDHQVMTQWVRSLKIGEGSAAKAVAKRLDKDEKKAIRAAKKALTDFPRKRWKHWRKRLPKRSETIASRSAAFATVALHRAGEAAGRERRWRGHESQAVTHSLRIALKEFRYTIESFMPELYGQWKRELKTMQDYLGEVHDLDVLRGWILKLAKKESLAREKVRHWNQEIERARKQRVDNYQKKSSGAPDRWQRWRDEIASEGGINPSTSEPSSA